MYIAHPIEENQQRVSSFFQNKPVSRMNEKFICITNYEKTEKNEWIILMILTFFGLDLVNTKKLA